MICWKWGLLGAFCDRIAVPTIALGYLLAVVDGFSSLLAHRQPCRSQSTSMYYNSRHSPSQYSVDGVECREVPIEIAPLGTISILEATACAQEDLVNSALLLDGEVSDGAPTSLSLNAGDPYGAVLWPAASAIAEYLLSQVDRQALSELSLLEVGTGTGLASLAASRAGALRVVATDYETVPLKLLEFADKNLNQGYTHATPIDTALFDLCDSSTPLPPADVVLAADIMYEPKTGRCMAQRTVEALQRGSRVLVGDSPGRAGRPAFLEALREMGVVEPEFMNTTGRTCSGPRHELICGEGSTSVSNAPRELSVAILDLDPETAFDRTAEPQ